MYITFYDRNFKAMANNSSLLIESFNRTRRAYDLNEFTCVCEPLTLEAQPVFGIIRKNNGDYDYAVMNPVIDVDKTNKGRVSCRDLKAIYNTEVLIDFSAYEMVNLQAFLTKTHEDWAAFTDCGFDVKMDFAVECKNIVIEEGTIPTEKGVFNVLEIFKKIFGFYDLYMETSVDVKRRSMQVFIGSTRAKVKNLNIDEYVKTFGRVTADINTAIAYTKNYGERMDWYLRSDNSITQDPQLRDLFPTRARIFTAETLKEASFEAIGELSENRYQEQIEIDIYETPEFERLKIVGFETSFNIYSKGKFYKRLPIGEIIDNEKNEIKLKIGYQPINFIQLIR